MSQSQSNQKERPLVGPTTNGSKLNTLEDSLTNNISDSQRVQEQDIDALVSVVSEIEDPGIYLICNRAQKVRGGWRFYVTDICDVGRTK